MGLRSWWENRKREKAEKTRLRYEVAASERYSAPPQDTFGGSVLPFLVPYHDDAASCGSYCDSSPTLSSDSGCDSSSSDNSCDTGGSFD